MGDSPRRAQGKRHVDRCALPRRRDQRDPAAELLRHEIIDDVKAEPGAALVTARGEERVENVSLDMLRDTAAIIREGDLDLVRTQAARLEQHVPTRRGAE